MKEIPCAWSRISRFLVEYKTNRRQAARVYRGSQFNGFLLLWFFLGVVFTLGGDLLQNFEFIFVGSSLLGCLDSLSSRSPTLSLDFREAFYICILWLLGVGLFYIQREIVKYVTMSMEFPSSEGDVFIVHRMGPFIVLIGYCYCICEGSCYIHINTNLGIRGVFGSLCDLRYFDE